MRLWRTTGLERSNVVYFGGAGSESPARSRSHVRWGGWVVSASVFALGMFSLVPSPYVIYEPGPVVNVLGDVEVQDEVMTLIEINGHASYPTAGSFDLLTVRSTGTPASMPNWFEVTTSWFDPSKTVAPIHLVYGPDHTFEQASKESKIMMANSQKTAIAAALNELKIPVPFTLRVGALSEGSAANGILEPGDVLVTVNGKPVGDVEKMRAVIADSGAGNQIPIEILRNSEPMTVKVTPKLSNDDPPVPLVGVELAIEYDFPFEIKIQLEKIGGPSGGQMFALGIIDKLTPGELNGGANVAGTGTIDADGNVGSIGGIRQKMYGAERAGATWFLAPVLNCDEVVGHVPDGITVIPVLTLKDSLAALEVIASGGSTASLPTCEVREAERLRQ